MGVWFDRRCQNKMQATLGSRAQVSQSHPCQRERVRSRSCGELGCCLGRTDSDFAAENTARRLPPSWFSLAFVWLVAVDSHGRPVLHSMPCSEKSTGKNAERQRKLDKIRPRPAWRHGVAGSAGAMCELVGAGRNTEAARQSQASCSTTAAKPTPPTPPKISPA